MDADTALGILQLKKDLEARLRGQPIEINYRQSCESTNQECMQILRHGSVVIADHQTAGRGRRGRAWLSPEGENIYCSIGLIKSIRAEYVGMISLQVGVCIAQVLNTQGFTNISLKWPNDVLLMGEKLGGILIETRVLSTNEFYLVIGFGLNVDLPPSVLKQIDRPATSLRKAPQKMAGNISRQRLLPLMIASIYESVLALDIYKMPELIRQFSQLDSYMGKEVIIHYGKDEISGQYMGIEKTGQIKIQTHQGLRVFSAAEISLREERCAVNR
jgi:BirA family biotin operon repressor/biotin-[acetyl-CoA-carboxylase] ligase